MELYTSLLSAMTAMVVSAEMFLGLTNETSLNTTHSDKAPLKLSSKEKKACNEKIFAEGFPCSPGFQEIGMFDTCLQRSNSSKAFLKANNDCYKKKSALLVIRTSAFDQTVSNIFKDSFVIWLGLKVDNKRWKWKRGWQDQPQVIFDRTPNYTNWEHEKEPDPAPYHCATKTTSGKGVWLDSDCSEKHFYVCQRRSLRRLSRVVIKIAKYDLVVGEMAQITCVLIGNSENIISFVISENKVSGEKEMELLSSRDDRISVYETEYIMWRGSCVKSRRAELHIKAWFMMNGRKVKCCSQMNSGQTLCDTTPFTLSVKSTAQTPKLGHIFSKDTLHFNCDAVVNYGGPLMWAVATTTQIWTWATPYSFKSAKGDEVKGIAIRDATTGFNDRGYTMSQTMTIHRFYENRFDDLAVACFSVHREVDNSSFAANTTDGLRSSLFSLPKFSPKTPGLHKSLKYTLPNGEKYVELLCDANVGTGGFLTWLIINGSDVYYWKVDLQRETFGDVPDFVIVEKLDVWFRIWSGPIMKSKLRVKDVEGLAKDTYMACFSSVAAGSGYVRQLNLTDDRVAHVILNKHYVHTPGPVFQVQLAEIVRIFVWVLAPWCILIITVACVSSQALRRADREAAEGESASEDTDVTSESDPNTRPEPLKHTQVIEGRASSSVDPSKRLYQTSV